MQSDVIASLPNTHSHPLSASLCVTNVPLPLSDDDDDAVRQAMPLSLSDTDRETINLGLDRFSFKEQEAQPEQCCWQSNMIGGRGVVSIHSVACGQPSCSLNDHSKSLKGQPCSLNDQSSSLKGNPPTHAVVAHWPVFSMVVGPRCTQHASCCHH